MKMQEYVIFAKKNLKINMIKLKQYWKVRDHCCYTSEHRVAAHGICNLKYIAPKGIPMAFHNGSDYIYHFIIKEVAEEFEGQFPCVKENIEKYITFSVSVEKEAIIIDKNG